MIVCDKCKWEGSKKNPIKYVQIVEGLGRTTYSIGREFDLCGLCLKKLYSLIDDFLTEGDKKGKK